MKMKVDDKVKVIKNSSSIPRMYHYKIGKIISKGYGICTVKFNNIPNWSFYETELEVINES